MNLAVSKSSAQAEADYDKYIQKKIVFGLGLLILILVCSVWAVSIGPVHIPMKDIVKAILGKDAGSESTLVIVNMRLPVIVAAIVAGFGLAISGAVMQTLLRNPLASPFTLGISHGAAFGAAISIVFLGAGIIQSNFSDAVTVNNLTVTTIGAFAGAIAGTIAIVMLAKWRGLSPEAVILGGIAMGALFNAGTMLVECFATDTEVASIVFWLFGDVTRASWGQIGMMFGLIFIGFIYFMLNRWNYNALESGEEAAKGLGVNTESIRLVGMIISSLIAAVTVSFLGIIGFIGLLAPHITRRIIGNDNRFLLFISGLMGALILLVSSTLSRIVIHPVILPVGIITSFLGAPLFLYILARKRK